MLPNFRKAENEPAKSPPSLAQTDQQPTPFPQTRAQTPANRSGERAAPSVIGPDLTIVGNLVSKGEVQVDGVVQGDIHGSHVIIGERAKISGGIVGEEVIVRGNVMGSVRGKRVMLQSTSHVEGDIFHQSIAIEQGAYFEGKSRRVDDPMAGVKTPETPVPRTLAAQH